MWGPWCAISRIIQTFVMGQAIVEDAPEGVLRIVDAFLGLLCILRLMWGASCAVFLDELDAIVGKRSLEGGGDSEAQGVQQRVLSTLLNEMVRPFWCPAHELFLHRASRNMAILRIVLSRVLCF